MGTVLIDNKERLSPTMISEAPTGGMSAGAFCKNSSCYYLIETVSKTQADEVGRGYITTTLKICSCNTNFPLIWRPPATVELEQPLLFTGKILGACSHPGRSEEHQPGGILCHMQPCGYPFAAVHTAV